MTTLDAMLAGAAGGFVVVVFALLLVAGATWLRKLAARDRLIRQHQKRNRKRNRRQRG